MKQIVNIMLVAMLTGFGLGQGDGTRYNSPPINLTSSLKRHKIKNFTDVLDYDIKNTNKYNGRSENTKFEAFDSLSRETLERFIVDRFNYFRKTKYNAKPLVWDNDLRELCYQHAVYQRLIHETTHFQHKKIPNFKTYGLAERQDKCRADFPKFKNISEGLINQIFFVSCSYDKFENPTYKVLTDMFFTPKVGYNTCQKHWDDIMNANWDCIYMYYDFEFGIGKNRNWTYSNVTIVFASYTDEYKASIKQ